MSLRPVRVLAALALAASPSAQTVHVVDAAGGPGSSFSDVQPAVDAAANGDIVVVRDGSYGAITIAGKALTVVGPSGSPFVTTGPIQVSATPAGSTTTLQGLGASSATTFALEVCACLGDVVVQSCKFTVTSAAAPSAASIVGSSVVAYRSTFDANTGSPSPVGAGDAGLVASGSSLHLDECTLTGELAKDGAVGGAGFDGGSGARVDGSFLFATASTLRGGDGGDGASVFGTYVSPGGRGGHGVHVTGAGGPVTSVVTRACTFQPGNGGQGLAGASPAGAQVSIDPGAGSWTFDVLATRALTVTNPAYAGVPNSAVYWGVGNELVWAGLSATSDATWLAAFNGTLLPSGGLVIVPLGLPPGTGITVPFTPALGATQLGATFTLQFLAYGVTDGFVLSQPRVVIVLDPSL